MQFRAVVFSMMLVLLAAGCAGHGSRTTSSVYAYLYPDKDAVKVEPQQAVLQVPVKVGITFVPDKAGRGSSNFWAGYVEPSTLDAIDKRELLEKIAAQFKGHDFIGRLEIIPSDYLMPGGSFENLAQVGRMYDVDVMALVSYDQIQTTDQGAASFSYWTLVGAYIIPGEKNTTTTLIDTAIFDIASKRMLFRAPGTSRVAGSATPINLSEALRKDSRAGFEAATAEMIKALNVELAAFQERIKERPEDFKVVERQGYTGGGGGAGFSLLLMLALFAGARKFAARTKAP